MGDTVSAAGAAVVKYCPLCGEYIQNGKTEQPLPLNIQLDCPECKNSFTVRGKRAE